VKRAFNYRVGTLVANRPVSLLMTAGATLLVASASAPALPYHATGAPPGHVSPASPQPPPGAGDGVPADEGRATSNPDGAPPRPVPGGFVGGIPATVLAAYQHAAALTGVRARSCRLPTTLLAAIGKVETGHARGGRVDTYGTTVRPIVGPVLNGMGFAMIVDTDGGRLDGDAVWDRAVGPMQFIPQTWARWAVDGNADGRADPHNVFDASLAAANYLCADSRDLGTPAGLRAAVLAYNRSDSYLTMVFAWMNAYAGRMTAIPDAGSMPHVDTAGPVDLLVRAPDRPVSPAQTETMTRPTPPDPVPVAVAGPSQEPPADVPPPSQPVGGQAMALGAEPEPVPPDPASEAVCGMLDSFATLVKASALQCPCTVPPPAGITTQNQAVLRLPPQLVDMAMRCAGFGPDIVLPTPAELPIRRPDAAPESLVVSGR
jgi:transglycosylase-like protein with SLT domain